MKRVGIATGIIVTLVVTGLGGVADAGERHRTQSAPYKGHSFESDCRFGGNEVVRDFWELECRQEKAVHDAVFSERSTFAVPTWARSVRVSIRDDSGRPVAFRIYVDKDAFDDYRFTNSTCGQRATLNLGTRTKRVSVARIGPLNNCGAPPTTGTVTATFSSKQSSRPSPRNYVSGCGVAGVSGIGFGWSCSYTASKAGGYFGAGMWQIRIVRGGAAIELEALEDPSCSPTGFIRAGDHVTVARTGVPFLDPGYVAAGDNVHCTSP